MSPEINPELEPELFQPELLDEVPELSPEEIPEEVPEQSAASDEDQVIPRELSDSLKAIIQEVESEETGDRSKRLRALKKFDSYWEGIQRVYWSDVAKDWQAPEDEEEAEADDVINVYRAYGESIIAALSTGVPKSKFFPADADLPEDILAARAHSKLADLVQKHNQAPILFIKALFILWNQHFVAAYHYPKESESFGINREETTELQTVQEPVSVCATCGSETETSPCPSCGGGEILQDSREVQKEVPRVEETPKSRMILEVYGSLNVVLPENTSKVEDAGYLLFYTEQDIALLRSIYPGKQDEIQVGTDAEEAWAREASNTSFVSSKVTVKQIWIRPWLYYRLGRNKDKEIAELQAAFSSGCYLVMVGNEILEARDEKLDDRWTITESPLSRTIYANPLGNPLMPIQDAKNELFALTKETVAHGIPETFYDSQIIDETKYSNTTIRPGTLFPVKRKAGQNISDSFFQLRSAVLSKELAQFGQELTQDGQFVVGAFPSIYGGPSEGNSGTLGEYAMSRNQALQRLQNYWKLLNTWWTTIMGKVVPEYVKEMKGDDKFVKAQGKNFVNVWIRKNELEGGSIGQVEPESSEQFPTSWAQKKDLLIQVLTLKNPILDEALFHPENANLVAQALGFPEVYVPGDEDRTKQLFEVSRMLATGQFIEIEPEVDNHPVHIEVIRAWMNSDVGQEVKFTNPQGYALTLEHLRAHLMIIAGTPAPSQGPEKGSVPAEKPPNEGNPEVEPPIASPIQ
jgi:hypothetical protein